MTIKKFIAGLNWRLVALHFMAAWFFMYSFQTLAVLHNTPLLDIIRKQGTVDVQVILNKYKIDAGELTYFIIWTSLANTA